MALSATLRKAVQQAQNKYSRSNTNTIKPKEGRNTYRLLAPVNAPWIGAAGEFWLELGVHWIKPGINEKPIAVVGCEDVVHQEPCAVCQAVEMSIAKAIDEETKKFFQEMRAKKSVLINALDRSAAGEEPVILELSPTTFGKVLELMTQWDDAGQDMTDLNNGVDIVITRSGKGLSTEYQVNPKPGQSAPVSKDVLDKCHDLKAYVEKEFFKGDENRALAAIQQASGIAIPQLAARTPTAALSSPAVAVADAEVPSSDPSPTPPVTQAQSAAPAPAETVAVAAPAEAPQLEAALSEEEVDDVLKELADL